MIYLTNLEGFVVQNDIIATKPHEWCTLLLQNLRYPQPLLLQIIIQDIGNFKPFVRRALLRHLDAHNAVPVRRELQNKGLVLIPILHQPRRQPSLRIQLHVARFHPFVSKRPLQSTLPHILAELGLVALAKFHLLPRCDGVGKEDERQRPSGEEHSWRGHRRGGTHECGSRRWQLYDDFMALLPRIGIPP